MNIPIELDKNTQNYKQKIIIFLELLGAKELTRKIYYSEPILRLRTNITYWKTLRDRRIFFPSQLLDNFNSIESTLMYEASKFLKIPEEEITENINHKDAVKKEWFNKNRETKEEIEEFYENKIYVISDLVGAKLNGAGFVGLRKMVGVLDLALSLKEKLGNEYLDYGSGIGASAILFGKYGFNVSIADISNLLLEFTSFRLNNRKIPFRKFNLKIDPLPNNFYSFITCFDVLEHAVNPIEIIMKIRDSLKSGGIVFFYVAFGTNPDNPTHIVSNSDCISKIMTLGFTELKNDRDKIMKDRTDFFIFKKI